MFIKQIDVDKALDLFKNDYEVKILVPGPGWEDYYPSTLGTLLSGCVFFRNELAEANPVLEAVLQPSEPEESQAPPLMDQLQSLPEAPRNRPPTVWMSVSNGNR